MHPPCHANHSPLISTFPVPQLDIQVAPSFLKPETQVTQVVTVDVQVAQGFVHASQDVPEAAGMKPVGQSLRQTPKCKIGLDVPQLVQVVVDPEQVRQFELQAVQTFAIATKEPGQFAIQALLCKLVVAQEVQVVALPEQVLQLASQA